MDELWYLADIEYITLFGGQIVTLQS